MANQLQTSENKRTAAKTPRPYFLNGLFGMPDIFSAELQNIEPKIAVTENKNTVMVTAELPGISEKDIDLEISANGYLTISGEKRHENTQASTGGYFSEISYGHFSRTIPLPRDLEYNKAAAEYNNGILSVSIPKTAAAQKTAQKITVGRTKAKSAVRKKTTEKKMTKKKFNFSFY